jgi:hypothetical protein
MESVLFRVLCPWRAPSSTLKIHRFCCLTATCSCVYIDFPTVLQELSSSNSTSFSRLILSSLLSFSILSPCHPPPAMVLSCYVSASPTTSSSPHPLPPLLKNSTWGQASGGGGDVQRRRMAAAALACVHAVQALGSVAGSGSNSSDSLLSELSTLVKVRSSLTMLRFEHDSYNRHVFMFCVRDDLVACAAKLFRPNFS